MTGWTWGYVEANLDIPRFVALSRYWRQHPPTHLLLAAFVGYKSPTKKQVNDPAEVEAFMRMFPMTPPPPKPKPLPASMLKPRRDSNG